ncbi:MAG: hypothetical protein HXS46_03950 [Theionarchaea archaeon]|nr:hypothetical protein [Theionarchaea archaeon]
MLTPDKCYDAIRFWHELHKIIDEKGLSFSYSSDYSYTYLTEVSAVVDTDIITIKTTYDYYRGWITSIQQPKGVDAGSGYDYLYSYDLLGRVIKKELPLFRDNLTIME